MLTNRRISSTALGALLLIGIAAALIFPAPSQAIPLEQTVAPEQTPFVNPFFTPAPTECPISAGLQNGDTAVLTGGVLIRYEPNPSAPFIVQFQENRVFTVLEGGPLCVEGYNWYPITGHGVTGWASEGSRDGSRYWLTLLRRADEPEFPCLTPLNLTEGNRFNVNVNVRMRAAPTTTALTLTVVPYTATIVVLEGPVCNEGYNWWKVRATVVNFTYEGWVAESERAGGAEYIRVPRAAPCHAPLNLDIGEQARVIYNDEFPKRLRSEPSLAGSVLAELIENVPILILDGPVCANTYNWWKVRVLSSAPIEGWLAEGGPSNWWIAPVSEFR